MHSSQFYPLIPDVETDSTANTPITNQTSYTTMLSVTLTATGRPIFIGHRVLTDVTLSAATSGSVGFTAAAVPNNVDLGIRVVRDPSGTPIVLQAVRLTARSAEVADGFPVQVKPGTMNVWDFEPGTGSVTYAIQYAFSTSGFGGTMQNWEMYAFQLVLA